ncbi:hypothetical protein AB0952_35975 [Streptomyces caniferus]|uniref:hypothetical protein n=1 Tax=Streptomyces caniferus TaxID=285557 RepID=UPI0034543B09
MGKQDAEPREIAVANEFGVSSDQIRDSVVARRRIGWLVSGRERGVPPSGVTVHNSLPSVTTGRRLCLL